jgi:two-component system, OmpR family, sensor histidine kinase KdpD
MTEAQKAELARVAGLRDFQTPVLEDVDRRRSQLWMLSLLVGLAIPVAIVVLGFESLHAAFADFVDIRTARLVLLALLVALFGYVAERERALRNLSKMLVEERVLTATLVARIQELDALLEASRAMNSSLNLTNVLDVILRSACDLLGARNGSIQLVCEDDPEILEVVAVHGDSQARLGHRQLVGDGLAGGAAQTGEALLVRGPHDASRTDGRPHSALLAPLMNRGQLVGVLNVAAPEDGAEFNEFQLRSVAVFGETAAAAIANARVHEVAQDRVAKLTELDRLKDEFLQLVTHELRTPLTSLIGLASTLVTKAESLEPDRIRQGADLIRTQGWRLERLVNDLLKSAEAQRGTLELSPAVEDVNALVSDLVEAFRKGAQDHEIALSLPEEPLIRAVDGDALSRILTNLLGNAVKYAPRGTTVWVALRPSADGVVLVVGDEGPGIPEDQREDLFTKFQRGAMVTHTNGLGLGLYIVRSLAEAHGGDARVGESASGGSEFVVRLADLSDRLDAVPAEGRQSA